MRRVLLDPRELLKSAMSLVWRPAAPVRPEETPATVVEGARLPRPALSARVGKHDAALVRVVVGRPGLTVAQVAAELEVHPTALYPVIRRLQDTGEIVKVGRELRLAVATAAAEERLWCEEGHFWERHLVRGRKPRRCPEHR